MNLRMKYVVLASVMFASVVVLAQVGGIRGMVMDQDFDVPLPGVKVVVSETGQEVVSGDAGAYNLENIEPGAYTLLFSKEGYVRTTKSEVVVTPGALAEAEVSLVGDYEDMEELVVRDIQMGGASEIGLLNLRMDSTAMMDSVGADEMSKAGASDAAGALKLVAGATVQDGKYAVVRGLPDRYVSSQMNGVRLPSAYPDKRAVQLDQFPSVVIESIQVAKTFTPDQQGDASGGAVNVVLKGIPDETVLSFKAETKYKTNVNGEDFLTYKGENLDYWGDNGSDRNPQLPGTPWKGAMGVHEGDAPDLYSWSLTAGEQHTFDSGIKIGGMANFYYKHDAGQTKDGFSDKYWVDNGVLKPFGVEERPSGSSEESFKTSLYDVQRSVDEVQWGGLSVFGVESENNKLKLLYNQTHVAQNNTTLAEDTRGKQYVYPGYNPYDTTKENVDEGKAPYRRSQTLEYIERDTQTLQLSGEHILPTPELSLSSAFTLLSPEFDWMVARSKSVLDSPDKRVFQSLWSPGYADPGFPPWVPPSEIPPAYSEDKSGDSATLGNAQRIWNRIKEDSDQYFINTKLPFEQWSDEEGFIQLGYFYDKVERKFDQDTYSNFKEGQPDEAGWSGGDWSQNWGADVFPLQEYDIYPSYIDVDYKGTQKIDAWYYMVEFPLSSMLKVIGGARYETTKMDVEFDPEKDVQWTDPEGGLHSFADDPPPYKSIDQHDVLPAIGLELTPLETLTLRAHYSETVARPTFKE